MNSVGTRRLWEAGKYAGQPNQKLHKLYVVAARKAAEDIASVGTLLCSALRFAFAVDFSQTNHCKNNIYSDSI